MTVIGAFTVGISGLQAQSNKIGVISDNIANQSTIGYKATSTEFQTLISRFGTAASYSPGGVMGASRQLVLTPGNIRETSSLTDVAINGAGFFPVSSSSSNTDKIVYTRAGAFSANKEGYYVNSANFYLKGWALDSVGALPAALQGDNVSASAAEAALTAIYIPPSDGNMVPTDHISIKASLKSSETPVANTIANIKSNLNSAQLALPTSTLSMVGLLNSAQTAFTPSTNYDATNSSMSMASGAVATHFNDSVKIIDNTGAERNVRVGYLKTGANSWAVELYMEPKDTVTSTDGQIGHGTITFNANGTLASVSSGLSSPINIAWNNVGGPTSLTLNFGTIGSANGMKEEASDSTQVMFANPDYSATSATKSMAAGTVTPHFSTTIGVIDGTNTTRTLTASFLKIADNRWAVEIYSAAPGDVTSISAAPGQVASGEMTFNADGTLASISPALRSPVGIEWTGATEPTMTTFNLGALGSALGVKQEAAAFSATAVAPTLGYNPTVSTANMASGSVPSHYGRDVDVVDTSGVKRTVSISFLKTGPNTWAIELHAKTASNVTTPDGLIAYGNVTFNGDGTLASISDTLSGQIAVPWSTGAAGGITVDWGTAGPIFGTPGSTVYGMADGLYQADTQYTIEQITVNGAIPGKLSNVAIDSDGFVTALYDNDSVRKLYKVPLAVFHDENLLTQLTGNIFEQNAKVGTPLYAQAGKGGSGAIASGQLEMSNVEIASQLTDMIIAQRAYQSNTKIVTTTDSMLETITRMLD